MSGREGVKEGAGGSRERERERERERGTFVSFSRKVSESFRLKCIYKFKSMYSCLHVCMCAR